MDALILSVRLAACVSVILLLIGMPLAYWLPYWNWRGKFLLEALVALPLVLPPTVLGFYVLIALGPHGPIGKISESLFRRGLASPPRGLFSPQLLFSSSFTVH